MAKLSSDARHCPALDLAIADFRDQKFYAAPHGIFFGHLYPQSPATL